MTKRTNAELLNEANERVARLRRVEAAKGDPRITQARKLLVALDLFNSDERPSDPNNILPLAVKVLEQQADAWVEEFFAPKAEDAP